MAMTGLVLGSMVAASKVAADPFHNQNPPSAKVLLLHGLA
jgi:hypothetical protein